MKNSEKKPKEGAFSWAPRPLQSQEHKSKKTKEADIPRNLHPKIMKGEKKHELQLEQKN